MDLISKLKHFDYFLTSIFVLGTDKELPLAERVGIRMVDRKSISKLKALKLLFFTVAIDKSWSLLDNVFDNFCALPYGPVESDIYDNLGNLPNYVLIGNDLKPKADATFDYGELPYKDQIDKSVSLLAESYSKLFEMSAMELVELTHRSDCWIIPFEQAKALGSMSRKMPAEVIKNTIVYFE